MRFSVIVPVYNVEKYLEQCVNSIISQDFEDFEVILIDDGSTDRSGKLCDIFSERDNRIQVLHKSNGGLSDARNYGLSHAVGEYIVFVDGDDWITSDCLKRFNDVISDGNCDVLETTLIEAYPGKMVYKDRNFEEYLQGGFERDRALKWIISISENTWPAPKKILRREFVEEHNLRFLKGYLHEDLDWTVRVCYFAKKYAACSHPWYYHRMNRENSITSTIKRKNIIDVIEMADMHYEEYIRHESGRMIFNRIMISVYGKLNQAAYMEKDKREDIIKCMKCNQRIFSVAPNIKYKLFAFMIRIFGCRNALKALRVFRRK